MVRLLKNKWVSYLRIILAILFLSQMELIPNQVFAASKMIFNRKTSPKPRLEWGMRNYLTSASIKVKEFDPDTDEQTTIITDSTASTGWTFTEEMDIGKLYKVFVKLKNDSDVTKEKLIYYLTPEAKCHVFSTELNPVSSTYAAYVEQKNGGVFAFGSAAAVAVRIPTKDFDQITSAKIWFNANNVTATLAMGVTVADPMTSTISTVASIQQTYDGTITASSVSQTFTNLDVNHSKVYYFGGTIPANTYVYKVAIYYQEEKVY